MQKVINLEKLSTGHEPGEINTKSLQMSLQRYCLALTQSTWDAEDLVQETWVKVLGYIKNLEATNSNNEYNKNSEIKKTSDKNPIDHSMFTLHPNPEALLFRIAKNIWIDMMRRKATLSRLMELEPFKTEEICGHDAFEIEAAIQALQEHLSPLQQAVFLLRDVFGHSGMEAADVLDTTEGAVKAALYRARQALSAVRHELLQSDGPPLPQDIDMQNILSRLAFAYAEGHISELMKLVLANTNQEPVMAVSSQRLQGFQTFQSGGFSSMSWSYAEPGIRMVA